MPAKTTEASRISQINSINGNRFIRWVDGYSDRHSVAVVECKAGHQRTSSVNNLVNHRRGCKECYTAELRADPESVKLAINARDDVKFIGWPAPYKNNKSKARVQFFCGHEHDVSVHGLLVKAVGCPACSAFGFNTVTFGFVYALVSDCGGLIKVGITNNPNQRETTLRRYTPFGFNVAALRVAADGAAAAKFERSVHRRYESAGLSGFDGATEWFRFSEGMLDEVMNFGWAPNPQLIIDACS